MRRIGLRPVRNRKPLFCLESGYANQRLAVPLEPKAQATFALNRAMPPRAGVAARGRIGLRPVRNRKPLVCLESGYANQRLAVPLEPKAQATFATSGCTHTEASREESPACAGLRMI